MIVGQTRKTGYIRFKRIGFYRYGYLVGSRWNSKRRQSYQITIKYLGKNFTIDDIPTEYRSEAVIRFFSNPNRTDLPFQDSHVMLFLRHTRHWNKKKVKERKIAVKKQRMLQDLGLTAEQYKETIQSWKVAQ